MKRFSFSNCRPLSHPMLIRSAKYKNQYHCFYLCLWSCKNGKFSNLFVSKMNNAIGVFRICQKFTRITDTLVKRKKKSVCEKNKRENDKKQDRMRGERMRAI